MGRWAQRTIRGGGPPATAQLNYITTVVDKESFNVDLRYAQPIDVSLFAFEDFVSNGTDQAAGNLTQLNATDIRVAFALPIDTDLTLTYAGSVTSVLTPQTIAY